MDVAMLERTDHSKAKANRKGTSAGNRARPAVISREVLDIGRIQYHTNAPSQGSRGIARNRRNPDRMQAERAAGYGGVIQRSAVSAQRKPKSGEGATVTYRRVQGGEGNKASQSRIVVNKDGTIRIENKSANLSVSIDEGQHAQYFLSKRGRNARIVEVDVPKWLDICVQNNAIPQFNSKKISQERRVKPPKITDPTTPGRCFELPPPWIEWLEKWGSHARIVSSLEVPDPAKTGKPKGMGTG